MKFSEDLRLTTKEIFPTKVRNPYYIVASRYLRTSAGIKSLHILCHALNSLGERAYMIIHPFHPAGYSTNPDLLTPLLTPQIIQSHFRRGLTPIMVYPETIKGNPFMAPFVVRYILNYPGLLGGDSVYDHSEFCIAYSKKLGDSVPNNKLVLFIPTSDPNIFYPPQKDIGRNGTCFYAAKYKDYHNASLSDVTKGSFEITRDRPDSLTQQEIAELFRKSELFYCYENSALVIESVLCGCPAVFIPNEHLKESLGADEIGWDGIAWGTDSEEIKRAKITVEKGRLNYLKQFENFGNKLKYFVELTQKEVSLVDYLNPIKVPFGISSNCWGPFLKPIIGLDMFRFTVSHSGLYYAINRGIRRIFKKGFKIDLDRIGN